LSSSSDAPVQGFSSGAAGAAAHGGSLSPERGKGSRRRRTAGRLGGDAARQSGRADDGAFTLVEILVALGVVVVVVAAVLSAFAAGVRLSTRSTVKCEASRVGRAVYDLLDKGFNSGTWHGRNALGEIVDETLKSQQASSVNVDWSPAYVVRSPARLVWKAVVDAPWASDSDPVKRKLHTVCIVVCTDDNASGSLDAGDGEVAQFQALLADREAPP
jgi:type II secretory pathway pseudopilin PulG